jgi:hypothetical protein
MNKFLSSALVLFLFGAPVFTPQVQAQEDNAPIPWKEEAPRPLKFVTIGKMAGGIYEINMPRNSQALINFVQAGQIASYSDPVTPYIGLEYVKGPTQSGAVVNTGVLIVSKGEAGNSEFFVEVDTPTYKGSVHVVVHVGRSRNRTVKLTVLPDPPVEPAKPLLDTSKVEPMQRAQIEIAAAQKARQEAEGRIGELTKVIAERDAQISTMRPADAQVDAIMQAKLDDSVKAVAELNAQLQSERAKTSKLDEMTKTIADLTAQLQEERAKAKPDQSQAVAALTQKLEAERVKVATLVKTIGEYKNIVKSQQIEITSARIVRKDEPDELDVKISSLKKENKKLSSLLLKKKDREIPSFQKQIKSVVSVKIVGETEAALGRYKVPTKNGEWIEADRLLDAQEAIWLWNGGQTRRKLSVFISTLANSTEGDNNRAIQKALDASRLGWDELKLVSSKAATL